jgi:hypothetical protein
MPYRLKNHAPIMIFSALHKLLPENGCVKAIDIWMSIPFMT